MKACGLLLACLAAAAVAEAARVNVTASKTSTLNAGSGEPSCTDLSKLTDDALPSHVVRLHADLPTPMAGLVRYTWSLPTPNVGRFLAGLDLGPDEQNPVIRSLCTEIGNECVLTEEQLAVYDKPTILWVAPACDDALPTDASRPYRGGRVKIGVKATSGKKTLGKGATAIAYGKLASVVLLLNGRQSKPGGVASTILGDFYATVHTGGGTLPAIESYHFDNGDGDSTTIAATTPQAGTTLLYKTSGKHVGSVVVNFADESALCDNVLASLLTSVNVIRLNVTRTPKRATYRPGDPGTGTVRLRVQVKNVSDPEKGGRGAVLLLGKVLTCETDVKAGDSSLKKTTDIDFQHCASTVGQACTTDADCAQDTCPECQDGERCLTSSHCEIRLGLGCVRDSDCNRGPGSDPDDHCVTVLPLSSISLMIGDSATLVDAEVPVANTLATPVKVKETWTVHAKNAPDDTAVDRYGILSNPSVAP